MQLTTHTDYALRLLIYMMSHPGRKVTTAEVAEAYGISRHHLTKVAKSLTRGGWLVASRGSGGGLILAPHAAESRIGDIVRYSERGLNLAECFDKSTNTCPLIRVCLLKSVLDRAKHAFMEVLDASTLRDIAANPSELKPLFSKQR